MKERVSALLDGALDEEASARVLDSLKRDAALRREWGNYCLIGDVLRENDGLALDISRKVMLQIEDEPTVLAPVVRRAGGQGVIRHLMPVAASLMGVAAVAWVAVTLNFSTADGLRHEKWGKAAVLASAPAAVPLPVAVDTSELEHLFAHQTLAPSAAMPGVALYVRTVADVAATQR
jgi:sigma-E factor negative regulatory protein RseA